MLFGLLDSILSVIPFLDRETDWCNMARRVTFSDLNKISPKNKLTPGEPIAADTVVFFDNGQVFTASSASPSCYGKIVGVATQDSDGYTPLIIQLGGLLKLSSDKGFTPNEHIYINNMGALTNVKPSVLDSYFIQSIGFATASDTIFISLASPYKFN